MDSCVSPRLAAEGQLIDGAHTAQPLNFAGCKVVTAVHQQCLAAALWDGRRETTVG